MAPREAQTLRPQQQDQDADEVARIAASMAEFGWTVPVLVVDDGELIAGHGRIMAGRRCFAMELDPVYCDVAVRRWEMATGKSAMVVPN